MSTETVSLVIPGRNCAATIEACLSAVVPLLDRPPLCEILFVDDDSTDETAHIVERFPITVIRGHGRGPGAARNLGWRAARSDLVWFVDADCVAQPDALDRLLPEMDDPKVGGVSGSYGIMNPESLLACLIHEEIIERHLAMPRRVDFLATFNVLYRRAALEKVGGFDERLLKGQDAELSWRVMEAGYELRFAFESKVKHFHETSWRRYLITQRQQGFWRVFLHLSHQGHTAGDSYSRLTDHLQPPLAVMIIPSLALLLFDTARVVPIGLVALLMLLQGPMTFRLLRRTKQPKMVMFACMSFLRAFWRGLGMVHGLWVWITKPYKPVVLPNE